MKFEGQTAIDTIFFATAISFALVCIGHIAMLWSLRRDFFIVLRSPRLTCVLGLSSTLSYLCLMYVLTVNSTAGSSRQAEIAHLLSFPAMLTAMVALIMIAVRLLVMYYPSERARWGRYTKEVMLAHALIFFYVSAEIAVWSAAWSLGMSSVAAVVKSLRPLSAIVTVVASCCLVGRLRRVDDAGNISRDIRLVGGFLLGVIVDQVFFAVPSVLTVLQATLNIVPIPSLAQKYVQTGLHLVSNPFINWVCTIRPVREVVHNIPPRRRSKAQALLATPHRRSSSSSIVAVMMSNPDGTLYRQGSSCDANRLAGIMQFLPLREAFGDFCRRSLCSESFQFLLDVAEFKSEGSVDDAGSKREEKEGFRGFGSFLAIVNDYIKDGAHSEINIEFRTKTNIMKYSIFTVYSTLDLEGRRAIFSDAAEEIGKMLMDNLLNRFLMSPEYKAVVDFEGQST